MYQDRTVTHNCLKCKVDCSELNEDYYHHDYKNNIYYPICYNCEYKENFQKCFKCDKKVHCTYWDPFVERNYSKVGSRQDNDEYHKDYFTHTECTVFESMMKSKKFCYHCCLELVRDMFNKLNND